MSEERHNAEQLALKIQETVSLLAPFLDQPEILADIEKMKKVHELAIIEIDKKIEKLKAKADAVKVTVEMILEEKGISMETAMQYHAIAKQEQKEQAERIAKKKVKTEEDAYPRPGPGRAPPPTKDWLAKVKAVEKKDPDHKPQEVYAEEDAKTKAVKEMCQHFNIPPIDCLAAMPKEFFDKHGDEWAGKKEYATHTYNQLKDKKIFDQLNWVKMHLGWGTALRLFLDDCFGDKQKFKKELSVFNENTGKMELVIPKDLKVIMFAPREKDDKTPRVIDHVLDYDVDRIK